MNTNQNPPEKNLPALVQEFADVERYHLTPGIFQTAECGKKPAALEVYIDLPDGGSLKVTGPKPLHPFDAVLLCAVLCKAAQDKKTISPGTQNPLGIELRSRLELMEDSLKEKCLAYNTNARELTRSMGLSWKGSKSLKQIEESLERMFTTSFILKRYKDGKKRTDMFRLLSNIKIREEKDITVAFGINTVLAEALLSPGHFARIDMEDLRKLQKAEQLMFIQLSNTIDPGKKRSFTPGQIREFLHGNADQVPEETVKKQTQRARAIAKKVAAALGWGYEEIKPLIRITRPVQYGQKHRKSKTTKTQ